MKVTTAGKNGEKLTSSKLNRANRKQTEEMTYVTVLTALVQYINLNINNVD